MGFHKYLWPTTLQNLIVFQAGNLTDQFAAQETELLGLVDLLTARAQLAEEESEDLTGQLIDAKLRVAQLEEELDARRTTSLVLRQLGDEVRF